MTLKILKGLKTLTGCERDYRMIEYGKYIAFQVILICLATFSGCARFDIEAYTESLPHDGNYSEDEGTGGSYKDPIHGFFVIEPPTGFKVVEKHDRATVTVQSGRPHAGEEVPRSWIQFKSGKVQIGVIARETWSDLEADFNSTLDLLKSKGATIQMRRYITIDGVRGGESILSLKGTFLHAVKYKKNGLDHSISISGPPRECQRFQKQFLELLECYRSLNLDAEKRARL